MHMLIGMLIMATSISAAAQQITRHQADSLTLVLKKITSGPGRIEPLLRLADYHVFKPGENKVDFDSASACLEEASQINRTSEVPGAEGRILLTQAFMYREQGDEENGRKSVERAIPLLEKGPFHYYLGKAFFELSGYYDWLNADEIKLRIELTEKAVKSFHDAGEMEDKGHALRMLGDLYASKMQYAEAIQVLKEALSAYKLANHKKLQGVYDLLCRANMRIGDFKNAIQYGLMALETARAVQDTTMQLATINNTIGTIYRQAGRKELAIQYYKDALNTALHLDETSHVLSIAYNAAICCLDLHRPRQAIDLLASLPAHHMATTHPIGRAWINTVYMRAYELEGNNIEASKYAAVLEKLIQDPNLPEESKNTVFYVLGRHFIAKKDLAKSRHYLNQASLLAIPQYSLAAADRAYLAYRLDSVQGDYKSALSYFITYKKISDSLFDEVKNRQFAQLEVEYETTQKADSILLLTQKSEIQHASLRQTMFVKNITIAGIVLASLIIALLYRQYRTKQKNNMVIAGKNEKLERLVSEKEWLLKEVHHRVKNNLQTIMSLLELQSGSVSHDAKFALQTSQNRIYATSLLHQKLYRSDNLSAVNMDVYLNELIQHLSTSLAGERPIAISTHITPIELDVTQGVPIGLIVNEIITNAFKYAFDSTKADPQISVSLTTDGQSADLVIEDNGIGIPNNSEASPGLGLKLVQGLAEDIDGQVTFVSHEGTRVMIRFKPRLALATAIQQKKLLAS